MKITVEFNSLEELQEFQNGSIIKGATSAQKPAEEALKEKPEKVTPNEEKPVQADSEVSEAHATDPSYVVDPPKEPTPKKLTASDLKVFAATRAKAGYRSQLKALLTSYGEKSVTDLTEHQPEKMQEFYDKLKEETNAE